MGGGGGKEKGRGGIVNVTFVAAIHVRSLCRGKVFFSNLLSPLLVQGMLQPTPREKKEGCGIPGKKQGPTASSGPDPAQWLRKQG